MSGSNVRGLSTSAAALSSSNAICSHRGSDVCAITSEGPPAKASGVEPSVKAIDGDFDCVSSHCALWVRLRFLLFGPSMPAYMPAWLPTLSDALRNGIRDGVKIGSGSEDGGELRGKERG